jgi:hypothetical protein
MIQSKETKIANICYAIVSGNFAMFCNTKNCGPNFKWSEFAEMQEDMCLTDIWIYIPVPRNTKAKQEIKDMAAKFGREIAESLIRRAGF